MIIRERYGVRPDGNVVIETTQYIETIEAHPRAVQFEGVEGYWVKSMVGNSLSALGAQEVTYQEYQDAESELDQKIKANRAERERQDEIIRQEMEDKRDQIRRELTDLGLSPETVNSILTKVRR